MGLRADDFALKLMMSFSDKVTLGWSAKNLQASVAERQGLSWYSCGPERNTCVDTRIHRHIGNSLNI